MKYFSVVLSTVGSAVVFSECHIDLVTVAIEGMYLNRVVVY